MNGLAQRFYTEQTELLKGRSSHDPLCVAIQIVPRALSSFQGAIILAERGMNTEALTLVRSIYECGFWIGYLHESPDAARDDFFADTIKNEIKVREIVKGLPFIEAEPAASYVLEIDQLRVEAKKYTRRPPDIKTVSDNSGFGDRYAEYRRLCGMAAHTSLTSIMQYISFEQDGTFKGHVIGPNETEVPNTLGFALGAMMIVIEAFRRATRCADFDDEFGRSMDRYVQLMGAEFRK
ncbi:DUF5677 domain-containing protein [Sphingomonas sp. ZB1N12]|uniref:DUF5677 domain-containing protein n=1 Tax=Sphingomonas arabinosi TaxID=3096160 RepID=UPI002FC66478